ncbi:MAG: tRNA uridine-5-carboxymethylaminomethyl(34) synthesis GTPase MnmE [Candidatus Eremiobacteraeota bacterium]|nr:tRNA uridine-5-carboxymethylaminomethyl(34) synthesis GTPase MnmE [Candidatus Eremiobacteraeota bacterium]
MDPGAPAALPPGGAQPNGRSAFSTDTIVAIATPPGKGAIAIVRLSGPAVPSLSQRLVRTNASMHPRVATRADVLDEGGRLLDRALAISFSAPHSYTGEAMLELQLHGSPVVAREVVRAALACGARLAQPGEFTRRAFLNGKLDLHAAVAVADLVGAETRAAAAAALANLGGGLAEEIRSLRAALASVVEELAGTIDFPEEVPEPGRDDLQRRLEPVVAGLERLRHDGELGRLVREGVAVAIVGPPNAGKSSLLNALLGFERAIVSEIPGTTRDAIEDAIIVDGVPVRLIDTAGIRAHADRLEAAGIERTQAALAAAGIALVVLDGSEPLRSDALDILERTAGRPRIVFFNKADLGTRAAGQIDEPAAIVGSVRRQGTLDELRAAIGRLGWSGERIDVSRPHLVALHEFDGVNAALGSLREARRALDDGEPIDFIATELHRAYSSLGHVSERVAGEEVIDGIFSRFCIGK